MKWKKKDAVLILTVLLIAGASFGVHEFAGGDGADTVTVKVDGKVTGRLGSMAVRIYLR